MDPHFGFFNLLFDSGCNDYECVPDYTKNSFCSYISVLELFETLSYMYCCNPYDCFSSCNSKIKSCLFQMLEGGVLLLIFPVAYLCL